MRHRPRLLPAPRLSSHQPEHLHRLGVIGRHHELARLRVGSVSASARGDPDKLPSFTLYGQRRGRGFRVIGGKRGKGSRRRRARRGKWGDVGGGKRAGLRLPSWECWPELNKEAQGVQGPLLCEKRTSTWSSPTSRAYRLGARASLTIISAIFLSVRTLCFCFWPFCSGGFSMYFLEKMLSICGGRERRRRAGTKHNNTNGGE